MQMSCLLEICDSLFRQRESAMSVLQQRFGEQPEKACGS